MIWGAMLLKQWYWIVIVSLTCAAGVLMLHGRALKAERDLAESHLMEYRHLADLALKQEKKNNDRINKDISDAIPVMVEQAEKNAYANYLAKYGKGNRNAACGIRAGGVLPRPGGDDGQADRTESVDGTFGERLFVESCARDAGRLDAWRRWAVMHELVTD